MIYACVKERTIFLDSFKKKNINIDKRTNKNYRNVTINKEAKTETQDT